LIVRLIARGITLVRTRAALRGTWRRGVFFWRSHSGSLPAPWLNVRQRFIPASVWRRESGQTLVEMAFALPIILIFLLVIVDLGFAFDRREVIQHAVREGARYAAVGNDWTAVTSRTNEESGGALSNIQVCYIDENDPNSNPGNAGDSVRVSGEYTHDFGGGSLLGGAVPGIHMTPSPQARLEKTVFGANAKECKP